MTKKDVSRRGFLKGIVQTAGAAGLATMAKFFPEAKGAFARRGRPRLVNITTSSISSSRIRNLATRSRENDDTRKLLQFLRSRGGHFISDTNTSIQGRRTHLQIEDEEGNIHNPEMDIIISSYLYVEEENEQKVVVLFSEGVSFDIETKQVPILVIPQEGVYVVRDGEVVLQTNSSPLIDLLSSTPNSSPLNNNEIKRYNQETASHLPTCCDHFWECVGATAATLALFLLCATIAPPVCAAALVADFGGILACSLAYDCCISMSCDCY